MKICIINFGYPPYDEFGGGVVAVRIVTESLKKRGHDVFVITTRPYSGLKSLKPSIRMENGIKVYSFYPINANIYFYTGTHSNIPTRILTFMLGFWNPHTYIVVKKILKKESPDVVNINLCMFLSLSVYSAAKSLNVPIVSTIHDIGLLFLSCNLPYLDKIAGVPFLFRSYKAREMINKIYRTINKLIINSATPKITIFPTKAIKEIYSRYNFFKNSKNVVLPNMIDLNNTLKDEKTINKKTFDILYCGGFQRHKGGQTLIKAFRKIENPNIRLHIFGYGLKDVEEYFKKLAAGDERIIFYGPVRNDELQKFYKIVDIVVVPSECFENFSVVIIESFRARVPAIASKVGGTPELIKEGYNGFLFDPGNVEQLKNILEKAINNKEKLIEMGKNAYEWVKRLDSKECVKKLEEIYKEAIK